jgi:hypothetical protein
MLVRTRFGPGQQYRPVWQAELSCQRLGYQVSLVVASFPLPLPMQGYWNHHVSSYAFAQDYFGKSLAEPATQRLDTLKLQHDDRPHKPTFVESVAARPIEAVCSSLAVWARQGFWPSRILLSAQRPSRQRLAASIAQRTAYRRERTKTLSANWQSAGPQQQPVAQAASCRKEHADERVSGLGKPLGGRFLQNESGSHVGGSLLRLLR